MTFSHTLNSIEYAILLLYFCSKLPFVYTVSQSYIDIGGTMSKTAYIVRHINFENAGILESVLIDRGFELTYIEAPLVNFEHYDATEADLVIVCGAPIGAYDEQLYPFLTDEIKFITDRIK